MSKGEYVRRRKGCGRLYRELAAVRKKIADLPDTPLTRDMWQWLGPIDAALSSENPSYKQDEE